MKSFLGITLFSWMMAASAFAGTLSCQINENLGPQDTAGNFKEVKSYKVEVALKVEDSDPQLRIEGKLLKGVSLEVYACSQCSLDVKKQRRPEVMITFKSQGSFSNSLTPADFALATYSPNSPSNRGDNMAVVCSIAD